MAESAKLHWTGMRRANRPKSTPDTPDAKENVPIIEVFGQPVSGEDHVSRLGGAPIGNPVSDVDHRFLCAMAREIVTLAAPATVLTILPTLGPANRGPIGMKEGIVTLDG